MYEREKTDGSLKNRRGGHGGIGDRQHRSPLPVVAARRTGLPPLQSTTEEDGEEAQRGPHECVCVGSWWWLVVAPYQLCIFWRQGVGGFGVRVWVGKGRR